MGDVDIKDVPFLACSLSRGCPIWSDDRDFQQQEKVDVYTTTDIKRKLDQEKH